MVGSKPCRLDQRRRSAQTITREAFPRKLPALAPAELRIADGSWSPDVRTQSLPHAENFAVMRFPASCPEVACPARLSAPAERGTAYPRQWDDQAMRDVRESGESFRSRCGLRREQTFHKATRPFLKPYN